MKIHQHRGDLFQLAHGKFKAHCVSADLEMGAGIALEFRKRYGRPKAKTLSKEGGCILQAHTEERCATFHLVTKERYWHKPTLMTLRKALEALLIYLLDFKIRELWIPRIGAGLDKLRWDNVLRLLEDVLDSWEGTLNIVTFDP